MGSPFNILQPFGRFAANCMATSAGLATQTLSLGMNAGMETARVAAKTIGAVIPRSESVASTEEEVKSSDGEEPIGEPAHYSWIETATSSGSGSIERLAEVIGKGMRTVAGSGPGQMTLEVVLRGVRGASVVEAGASVCPHEKHAFVGVLIRSATAALRSAFNSGEAALRFGFRDTHKLRLTIEEGLEQMHMLGHSDEMAVFLPLAHPKLKARARQILERTPHGFLEALKPPPGQRRSDQKRLLLAFFREADQLGFFAVAYPRLAATGGLKVGEMLLRDELSFVEIDAFLEGRELA